VQTFCKAALSISCVSLLSASIQLQANEGASALVLEEILVTARKQKENIQTLSMSVSAIGETEISHGYMRDLRDIASVAPNLIIDHISAAPQAAAISLRGINFQDLERSFEPTVGVVLDGIFLGTNSGAELQIFDMERIEILRGPQGTLFGRNTVGGVINVIRTSPTGELGVKARVRAASYERTEFDGIVNFPIIKDTLAGKATYAKRRQKEGYNKNIFNGQREAEVDYEAYSLDFLFTPTGELSLAYTFQRQDDNSQAGPLFNLSRPADPESGFAGDDICVRFDRCQISSTNPETGDRHVVNNNFPVDGFFEVDAHTFEANWSVSDHLTLTYLFGRIDSDELVNQDYDATDLDYFHSVRAQEYEQTSHELRLAGDIGENISFVTGGYLWNSSYQLDQTSLHLFRNVLFEANFQPDNTWGEATTDHETDSWAVFFETDWQITDKWTLILGGRYSEDEKSFKRATTSFVPLFGPEPVESPGFDIYDDPNENDWSEFTPKVSLKYQWTEDFMAYATYSEGYRSGGMNGRANTIDSATLSYDPESLESIEIGFKSSWLDNRIQFNVAAFLQDYMDKQEDIVIAVPFPFLQETITVNAAEASIDGLELELAAILLEGWTVRLNVGLLDAEYDEFIADLTSDGIDNPVDNSHLTLRRTPDYTFSVNSLYQWQLGKGLAGIQGSYFYRDDFETEFNNIPEGHVEGFGLLDASLSYELENWRFSAYGRNLTDEDKVSTALNVAGNLTFSAYRQPRTYGVEITYTWAAN